MIPWDADFGIGASATWFNWPTDHDFFADIHDPTLRDHWIEEPEFRRAVMQSLYAFATGPMEAAVFNSEATAWHNALGACGVSTPVPTTMQAWISDRRAYILGRLNASNTYSFAITSNGGADFSTGSSPVTIQGTAPLEVDKVYLNGSPITVRWVDLNTWSVDIPLVTGANPMNFVGYDMIGDVVPLASDSITVTFTGNIVPLAGNLIISELMYKPLDEGYADSDDLEFIELKNIGSETLNLEGVYFDAGLTYAFTNAETLAAGEFIVLVSSNGGFAQRYPGVAIDGEYVGQLKNSGEHIVLVDSIGQPITSVDYLDVAPWPTLPDTAGYSLVPAILPPSIPQTNALEWTSSCAVGGSPREDDAGNASLAPSIMAQPADVSVAPGGDAQFECLAVSCPAPQYRWNTNGVSVASGSNTTFAITGVSSNLHGLVVQCIVSNDLGSVTSDFAVLLVETPGAGSAPVLDPLTNVVSDADSLVAFTARAADADIGQSVFYALGAGAPLGATMHPSSGVFNWTPSNSDEGEHLFSVIAYDNGVPSKSDAEVISITVNKINHAPVITVSNQVVNEESLLQFTVGAIDIDLPAQNLTYILESGVPTGATINATNGVFSWTPTEAQGPGTFDVNVRVTDDGNPLQSSSNVFQVSVQEVNRSPVISPIGSVGENPYGVVHLHPSGMVVMNPVVVDPDLPKENLVFTLLGAPTNVTVNSTNGMLRFDVDVDHVGGQNLITYTVQDSGSPVSEQFLYSVLPEIVQSVSYTTNGLSLVEWNAYAGGNYRVEYCDDLSGESWFLQEEVVATESTASIIVDISAMPYRVFRVRWLP